MCAVPTSPRRPPSDVSTLCARRNSSRTSVSCSMPSTSTNVRATATTVMAMVRNTVMAMASDMDTAMAMDLKMIKRRNKIKNFHLHK